MVATDNCQIGLYIVAKSAIAADIIEIHYTNRYAPTIEYLLRMLRKGFGWLEADRGTKEVQNTKCKFNESGFCRNPVMNNPDIKMSTPVRDNPDIKISCKEQIRASCSGYIRKYNNNISVNYVIIEKAGGIRGIE